MKKVFSLIFSVILIFTVFSPALAENQSGTLYITAYDASGASVPVPSGNSGERVKVRIPLICDGGKVHSVSISPIVSTSVEEFPFEVEKLDYTLYREGEVAPREIIEFEYDFALRSTVLSGLYEVKFTVEYFDESNTKKNSIVSVYVKVEKGYVAPTPDLTETVSMPVLMLESYSLSADKIYAGESFQATVILKNTSREESIKNVRVRLVDASNTIIPGANSSSSVYIGNIGRSDSEKITFTLETSPDAPESKYVLELAMSYEGASSNQTFSPASEAITVPVLQRQRVQIDEPIIYDEAIAGTVTGVAVAIYNMGKTPLYNCMITVEGDGLSLVENYFGGNLSSGGTLRPDLEILTSTAGYIQGNIVVTYEDAYGTQTQQKVPLNMRVQEKEEPIAPITTMGIDSTEPSGDGLSAWAWILICVAVAGIVVAAVMFIRKRRHNSEEF
ncbi:MAG: hypothetical protein IJO48_02060 [Clostridia bacterium]|nr:hypothetical protein [Clostridia bacterium]